MSDELQQPSPSELEEKLAKAERDRDDYLAGWQRAKADFINYKKEEFARMQDVARYGTIELMEDLISVLDNFDLGIASMEKQGNVDKGIYMIRAQLGDILKKRGLTKIEVRPGDVFDPAVAEAIAEAESEHPPGSVVEQIEPGYRLSEKIIRPARVKISKEKQ